MACHWERLSYLPSPHGFEETTSFLATSYLSDIWLRIEEILAELEPWQIMYERLVEFHQESSYLCNSLFFSTKSIFLNCRTTESALYLIHQFSIDFVSHF